MLPLPLPPYSVQNINFVGSIVRVLMTNITGTTNQMANIYFDDCGCTGTFFPDVVTAGHFTGPISNPPVYASIVSWEITGSIWNNSDPFMLQFINYRGNTRNPWNPFGDSITNRYFRGGMVIANSGSSSFESDWAGLYDIHYRFNFSSRTTQIGSDDVGPGKTANYDWSGDLYLEDRYFGSVSGTVFANAGEDCSFTGQFSGVKTNVFFQTNEKAVFRIVPIITNHGDDLSTIGISDTPLILSATIFSGLYSHIPADGDGSITYFIPHAIFVD